MNNLTKDNAFKIPDNLFESELLCFLDPIKFNDNIIKNKIILLHKICHCRISDFGRQEHIKEIDIIEREYKIIEDNNWQNSLNLEIKARCCDILRKRVKDKREITIKASNSYLEVFRLTHEMEYLERAVTIRDFKQVNNDKFLVKILNEILTKTIQFPFWLRSIILALLNSYSLEELSSLKQEVTEYTKRMRNSKDYHSERDYIDILLLLGEVNKQESHKLKALSFEMEADNIWNNRKENTYYPNLPNIYHNAYQEINYIKELEPEIDKRIRNKLIKANEYFIEMLSIAGIKNKMPFPKEEMDRIRKGVADERWNHPIDLLHLLVNIPFTPKDKIIEYMDICRKGSIVASMLGNNRLNDKGNTIGIDDAENSLRTEAHIFYRQRILFAIWACLEKAMNINLYLDDEILFYIMKKRTPSFLRNDDRLFFWHKGLIAGFNDDFMTASHILMPQVEYALRNIAEEFHGSLAKLEADRQDEATLGAILKSLEKVFDEEIWFEINSFLQSGIDVNFRNRLSHGLLSSFDTTQSGIYLWWLALKLYFNIDNILISKVNCDNE